MTARSPSAFLLSAALHGLFVAVALLFAYAVQSSVKEQPKVMELVAGEGDNYAATEAPALGVPTGIKISIPEPPAPVLKPPAPEPVVAPPVEAAPEPVITKAPEKEKPVVKEAKTEPPMPNMANKIKRTIIRKESQVKKQIQKEREAEQRRLTKEEFDRQNRARTAQGAGNPKVTKIDSEGIAGGVVGGSTRNKTGGAGGKALSREEGDLMDAYFSLVKRKMKDALDKPPGLSDSLTAVAEFRLSADGSISGASIARSSGSDEFDRAVLEAVNRYRSIGTRPDHKSEIVSLTFKMKEEEE
ncbi:MAG: TonB family protein [Verrucomicrobia bacterium]|nr:TonB family protein [Verrucomicrobiota bacterium]